MILDGGSETWSTHSNSFLHVWAGPGPFLRWRGAPCPSGRCWSTGDILLSSAAGISCARVVWVGRVTLKLQGVQRPTDSDLPCGPARTARTAVWAQASGLSVLHQAISVRDTGQLHLQHSFQCFLHFTAAALDISEISSRCAIYMMCAAACTAVAW